MTDEETTQSEPSGSEIAEELHELGVHLREILRTAWESPERRKVQEEIQNGLSDLSETINSAANEFSQSPTGQTLRADIDDFTQRVRSGEVETKVRQEILKALRMVNIELEKAANKDAGPSSEQDPEQAEEA